MKAKKSKNFEQLELFETAKYSRNYQAMYCAKIAYLVLPMLKGLSPRELKPVLQRFGLPTHGNAHQMFNRLESAKKKDNEKRMGF